MTTQTEFTLDDKGRWVIEKDPNALLDYHFDWGAWLTDVADAIDTYAFTVNNGAAVTAATRNGGIVTVWVSGGDIGTTVQVTSHITTTAGREDERSCFLKIKEQ